ncbi:MAG: valine--tRNA ligase [Leptospiraceae bacterium]|nr:valine--tRNA ligase [Leptospiraceae bacterium]
MDKKISDRYEPTSVEKKWIEYWEKNKSFSPNSGSKESFSIVIPPPNVTGSLHIGHALNHTIQDIMIRVERKKGKNTVWIPGTDHAGIATQIVVERELGKEKKKRTDFTRSEFEEKVWEWKKYSGGQITRQQRLLGESVDWDRERFTMDPGLSKAVFTVFKSLYDEGLIYRGERIINWCPKSLTAISDIEVEYRETKGHLYHIRYPIKGQDGKYIIVATTRPETMLGDVAVCAHPEDPRYKDLINTPLLLPLMNREIPLLADSFVDREFGSGLVKITPAHDLADFEAGQRLGLTPINVMNPDATMNENAGKYQGMDRYEARKAIIEELQTLGLMEKIEEYTHSVGHNSRGGAVIEPYLSTQWFVRIKPLAEEAIRVVRDGRIEFIPKMWEKTYFEWMENIKDWCISRQLWWGHRIPAYYLSDGTMFVAESIEKALAEAREKTGKDLQPEDLRQDEDVLDTWFSSGLWPFSVYGWPEVNEDLKNYYPNAVLVTGFDIIFFWVARMIMFGMKFQNEVPFHKVLIHGLVRDKHGKKFSKSLGNTIDPLEMMEKYGTDSFRFFLTASLPEGKDILFDESRLEGYRAFCNKIWNSSRFILMNLPDDFHEEEIDPNDLEDADHWIQNRFNSCLAAYEKAYSQYHFYEMASAIYEFIWGDFCDWYLELTKHRIYGKSSPVSQKVALQNLVSILKKSLNLLHPIMPFLTEEIHSIFSDKDLTTSGWVTEYPNIKEDSVTKISDFIEIVTKIRVVRAELKVPPDKKCKILIKTSDPLVKEILISEENSLFQFAKADFLEIHESLITQKSDSVTPFSKGEIVLPLSGLIDMEKEKLRLQKEKESIKSEMEKISKKIHNPEFLSKAKPEVITKEQEKYKLLSFKLESVDKSMEKFI